MMQWKREIRDILLGRIAVNEQNMLCTPGSDSLRLPLGIGDGVVSVRLLGLRSRCRACRSSAEQRDTLERVRARMEDIGRAVYLREQPEAAACLIRYVLTRPALLVFRYTDDGPVLAAWTGGGLTSWISRLRAFHSFGKSMPKGLEITERKVRLETKEKKQRGKRTRKKTQTSAGSKGTKAGEIPETERTMEEREI